MSFHLIQMTVPQVCSKNERRVQLRDTSSVHHQHHRPLRQCRRALENGTVQSAVRLDRYLFAVHVGPDISVVFLWKRSYIRSAYYHK